MINKIIPEGFKDDVSSQVSSEHKFKNMIIDHFQYNGFKLVKTPLIEYNDRNINKNIFKIVTKKNDKKLNIRDDITLQIARLSQTRLFKKKRPLKLCYYGEVVRKKGSLLRPERQFLQIGAECIGEINYLADVEMIELAYTSLNLVGIKDITIEISSRIFFNKFIGMIGKQSKINEIKRLIKLKDLAGLLKKIDKKYHFFIQDLFSCTGVYKKTKKNLDKLGIDNSTISEISNIKNIVDKFLSRNKNINIFLDLCEIDDKNYHSGVRFTFFANNIRGEIARGGRYILENFNSKDFATGFTCYMDTILRASSTTAIDRKILIPFELSLKKSKQLISKNYALVRYTGKLAVSKKIAKDMNCQFFLENNSIRAL